jgi:hypothetical protein
MTSLDYLRSSYLGTIRDATTALLYCHSPVDSILCVGSVERWGG